MGIRKGLVVCGAFATLSCGSEAVRTTGPSTDGFAFSVGVTAVPDLDLLPADGGVVSLRLGVVDVDGLGGTVDGGVATLLDADGAPLARRVVPGGAVIRASRQVEVRVEFAIPAGSAVPRGLEVALEITDGHRTRHEVVIRVDLRRGPG